MGKKYTVNLSALEVEQLRSLIKTGKSKARSITRAHILLMASERETDKAIAQCLRVHVSTVERTRARYVEGGIELAVQDRPHPPKQRKLDGQQEAFLIATACSDAPSGRNHWTMKLLAERMVSLNIVDSLSKETVRSYLKKTKLNLG
jgi:transposase